MNATVTTLRQIMDACEGKYTSPRSREAFVAGAMDTLKAMHEYKPGHELHLFPGDYPMYRREYMDGSDFVINTENAERIKNNGR